MANDFVKPLRGRAVTNPKDKVEDCERISVYELKRQGYFRGLNSQGDISVTVTYNLKDKYIKDIIPFTDTRCYFGGIRWWFVCPSCKKRVGVLYKPYHADYFRCRHCHNLTYAIRRLRGIFQTFCRVDNLRQKLLKLWEGKGQKGYSKQEMVQREKLIDKLKGFCGGR